MSGGGGGKKKTSAKAEPATYPGEGVPMTFAQGLPGQIPALAQQLSMGYGAPVSQNMKALEALYSPVSILSFPMPSSAPKKPAASSGGGGSVSGPVRQGTSGGRQLSRGNR